MKRQHQLEHAARRRLIENAALRCAQRDGLASLSHAGVAADCSVLTSESTVRRFFPRQRDLWEAAAKHSAAPGGVIDQAIELGVL